ncbi:MAG: hypothetical protein KGO96_08865 [Elusimicrobia bacterium]|nr:hypothetical protein [Elusimicrobiota bacterium]MDE2236386.1 hypothetical protein [Elusimicrobiota bacterium]MDE2426001.1 hypothetical protein [Elusimicrobiota bacterium]
MRFIKAAVAAGLGGMLLALAWPLRAAEGSAGAEAKFFSADRRGFQGNVREYDGNLYNPLEGSAWVKSDFGNALLDLGINDVGSSNESGRLDLNVGGYLGLDSSFGILTHRQPIVTNGIIQDGQWTPNTQTKVDYGGEDLLFKRTEENADLWLSCPRMPALRLLAGYWQETEKGTQPLGYDGTTGATKEDVTSQQIDRFTRDVTVGAQADVGKGEVSYTYTARKFADKAPSSVDSKIAGTFSGYPTADLSWVSEQRTDIHQAAFHFPLTADINAAGGVDYRERVGETNGYKVKVVDSNLGTLYLPAKDFSISARLYDHVMNTAVNNSFAAFDNASPPDPRIDFYQMRADVKARYTGIEHVALSLGYKPEYNYRRNADQRPGDYGDDALYQDGTFQPAETQFYGPQTKDTKHQVELMADFDLPAGASLSAGYRFLTANRAAYENSPTLGHYETVAIYVPLAETLAFNANWDGIGEDSDRSPNNFKQRLNRVLFDLQWSRQDGKASLGGGYAYERGKDTIDAYFGASNVAFNGNNVVNLIHIPDSSYDYENHVISANGMACLPLKLTARANLSYTISNAHWFVTAFDPYFTGASVGVHLSDLAPTEVRITHWTVSLARELYKNLSARASYDEEQWVDKLDGSQNGRIGVSELSLSAKF